MTIDSLLVMWCQTIIHALVLYKCLIMCVLEILEFMSNIKITAQTTSWIGCLCLLFWKLMYGSDHSTHIWKSKSPCLLISKAWMLSRLHPKKILATELKMFGFDYLRFRVKQPVKSIFNVKSIFS